jgi:hypothetical protein
MKRIVDVLVDQFNRHTVKNKNFDLLSDVLYVGDTKVFEFLENTLELDDDTIGPIIDEWAMRVYRDGNMPRIGDIIELTADMKEDPNPVLKGTKGEVLEYTTNFTFKEDYIDVKWFNGRGLKLIVGLDEFKIVS